MSQGEATGQSKGGGEAGKVRRRILPRTVKGWFVLVAGTVMVVVIVSYLLSRMTPSWYVPLDAREQEVLDAADRGQRKLTYELNNTLQRVPLGEQRWTITQNEINSMIAARLATVEPGTQATMGPAGGFSEPFVSFSQGKVTMAVRSPRVPGNDARGGVVSVVFSVRTTKMPDGGPGAVVKIDGAWLGNLPIPKSLVEEKARVYAPQMIGLIEKSLAYQMGLKNAASVMPEVRDAMTLVLEGYPFPLSFSFSKRQVVVKEVLVEDGSFTLVFEPPVAAGVRPR